MRNSTLVKRAGHVDAQATPLRAAILAAHGVYAKAGGFRAVDVRFFFRLFGNWLEYDVLRPSLDIELTQLRRTLETLEKSDHLRRVKARREKRFLLTASGMLELAEKLVEECTVSYDEVLFVLLFATSYRGILRARIVASSAKISQATRRRLGALLDPARFVTRAVRHHERLAADLRGRLDADRGLDEQVQKLLVASAGEMTEQVVGTLVGVGGYQLERVQPLKHLLEILPDDLRRAELTAGIASRRRFLFEPLLVRTEQEIASLKKLASEIKPT